MALLSTVGVRFDPLMAYNFTINLIDTSSTMATLKSVAMSAITDTLLGGFSECSGLDMALEVEEYKEGGNNGGVLKFPTRVTWAPLVLKSGVGAGSSLWDWHYDFAIGKGKRKDGIITLLNDLHLPSHIWHFRRGLPTKYTGPSLVAGQNTVAIEGLEITHEGLWQVPYVGFGAAAASLGVSAAVGGGF
ncbi:MAG: phage tail protein [Gemmatimonadaceae bacterium]|nr:phage tail protein [Gemmatimonadaceae bacterium]